jgi:uncharacterized protein (DUF1684 family)
MANIQASPGGMFAHTTFPPSGGTHESRRHHWTMLIGIAVLAVLAVVFGALALVRLQSTSTTEVASGPTTDMTAYAPGGSIYAAQVPQAVTTDMTAYAPGGSIYAAQVPQAVTTDMTAYAPGGSVYESQVP